MLQPTRLISTPFAQEGEKTEIQNVTGEFDNSATYQLGFPPITMQSIHSGGKPPKGTDFNGVLFDITENISFLCKGGRYQHNAGLSALMGGYPKGSNLLLDDNVTEVVSTVAGNQNNPNTDMTGWVLKPNRTTTEYVLDASGETQQQVNYNGGSKWYSRVGGYQENERVVLTNGDIVKSTINGNANDPNVNMMGWVRVNSASQIFDESGISQQSINNSQKDINSEQEAFNSKQIEINLGVNSVNDLLNIDSPEDNDRVFVKSYLVGKNKGGGTFIYDSTKALVNDYGLTISGWVRVLDDAVITPQMFGALGDGVADDTASIQRAIDALAAIATSDTRQTLFFPSGSYHTTVTLQAKTWVAIVGENKTSTRFLDAFSTGTFALQQFTTFSDLLFETTLNESACAFIGNNTSNINIQNVDVLGGEAFGNRSKFLKITGETWRTVLITNCVLDIGCQTGYGIDLQGSPTNPQNCDVHLDRVFLDTLLSPAFSCGGLRVKDIYGLHVRGSIFRTSANGSNITTEATNIALLKTDCVIENTSLDYGQTSFSSLFVGAGTKVILKNATFDTISNYGDVIIRGENNVSRTIPSNNRFTWFNKLAGTSYQEFNSGETVLNQPSRGTATDKPNPSILGVSIPSGDFTLIACLQGLVFNSTNRFGLCAFNSASGAHQAVQIFGSGRLTVSNYSLYTAFSADLINIPFKNPEKLWFKIQVSGSNIIYSVSTDSYAWTVLYTVSKTALTTFTHIGWFADSESNVTPYMAARAILKSWVIF